MAKDTRVDGTRQELIEAGLRLLAERGPVVGVTHIKLSDVVEAAGYSATAGYRYWTSQKAFHDDLVRALIAGRESPLAATVAALRPVVEARLPWQEAVRVAAVASIRAYLDDGLFQVWFAVRTSAFRNPALHEVAQARIDHSTEQYHGILRTLMSFYGRRVKPPMMFEHLVAVWSALFQGVLTRALIGADDPVVDREPLAPGVGREWTAYSAALETLLEVWTEPDD